MTPADRPTITPRVGDAITTAEQLDALPVGIVMRSRNDLLTETGRLGAGGMRVVWGEGWSDHAAAIEHLAPLTVLYVPGEQGRPSVTDDARAEMRRVLENQFGPFLARDPHDPDRFWDLAVDAVMGAADRAARKVIEQ